MIEMTTRNFAQLALMVQIWTIKLYYYTIEYTNDDSSTLSDEKNEESGKEIESWVITFETFLASLTLIVSSVCVYTGIFRKIV